MPGAAGRGRAIPVQAVGFVMGAAGDRQPAEGGQQVRPPRRAVEVVGNGKRLAEVGSGGGDRQTPARGIHHLA